MSAKYLVINRDSNLGKQTVNILRSLGYTSIIQANSPNGARGSINKSGEEILIILELSHLSTNDDIVFFKEFGLIYPMIITSPVIEKEFIVEASKFGVNNIVIKTTDQKYVAKKFKQAIDKMMFAAIPDNIECPDQKLNLSFT